MATTTQTKINSFLAIAVGKKFNPDHWYGFQCTDLIMAYGTSIYGLKSKDWHKVTGFGNAKDLFKNSPSEYWVKTPNNPRKPDQLPKNGDVIVYGARLFNPYGHIAIVERATRDGVYVIQQDGFLQSATHRKFLPWSWQLPIGWLSPKVVATKPKSVKKYHVVKSGDTMTAIAKKHKTTLANLKKLNPQIKNLNVIKVGQKVRVK